jgi:hypothetical protein
MSVDDLLREVVADAAYRPERDFLLNHPAFRALARRLLTLEARLDVLEGKPSSAAEVDLRLAELETGWRCLRRLQIAPDGELGAA